MKFYSEVDQISSTSQYPTYHVQRGGGGTPEIIICKPVDKNSGNTFLMWHKNAENTDFCL